MTISAEISKPGTTNYKSDLGNGPPTDLLGTPANIGVSPTGVPGWSSWMGDELEHVPELQWPSNVRVYANMRTDSQLSGLHLGTTMPVRRFGWKIDPNGAKPEIVDHACDDFGLDEKGQEPRPIGRMANRFDFDDHLRMALLSIVYGHYPFELGGEVRDDGLWHLTALAERPPFTISEINTDSQGAITSVKQMMGGNINTQGVAPPLTPDRLAWYVWDKEGANWTGRSVFRPCYKNWLLKDVLLRVDAAQKERNGMGIPVATAPPNASEPTLEALSAMMRRLRAGQDAGGSLPNGATMKLMGVEGHLPDPWTSINGHNEEMARSFLMMFMQLGHKKPGSRALGSEFNESFAQTLITVAKWFAKIFQASVIERWGTWNYGPDEQLPVLTYDARDEEIVMFAGRDLAYLVNAGVITVDEDLENAIRSHYALPSRMPGDPKPQGPTPTDGEDPNQSDPNAPEQTGREQTAPKMPHASGSTPRQRSRSVQAAVQASPLPLPDRPLRRQLYTQEVQASVDYAALDSAYVSARDALVIEVGQGQRAMIDALHDAIVEADGDLNTLANLSVAGTNADAIASRLYTMADHGASLARDEANRQGVTIAHPNMEEVRPRLQARAQAVDTVLANSLAEAASRKAIQLTGGSLTSYEVANSVSDYLSGLSDSYLSDQLGGAIGAAINTGRALLMRDGPTAQYYASEILDNNTCSPCVGIDGTEYQTIDDAEKDYPSGGFADCAGGNRCRGTLIAVYAEGVQTYE